jgi:hypothetical protein
VSTELCSRSCRSHNGTVRFPDRDMFMRYRGGGIGHKSTRGCALPEENFEVGEPEAEDEQIEFETTEPDEDQDTDDEGWEDIIQLDDADVDDDEDSDGSELEHSDSDQEAAAEGEELEAAELEAAQAQEEGSDDEWGLYAPL